MTESRSHNSIQTLVGACHTTTDYAEIAPRAKNCDRANSRKQLLYSSGSTMSKNIHYEQMCTNNRTPCTLRPSKKTTTKQKNGHQATLLRRSATTFCSQRCHFL